MKMIEEIRLYVTNIIAKQTSEIISAEAALQPPLSRAFNTKVSEIHRSSVEAIA
jgi:hypothetical protein